MSLTNEGVPFTMPVEPAGSSDRNSGWGGDWGAWIILFLSAGYLRQHLRSQQRDFQRIQQHQYGNDAGLQRR